MVTRGIDRMQMKNLRPRLSQLRQACKQRLKDALQSWGVYYALRSPRGADVLRDIRSRLPNVAIQTIFDIGANIGQSIAPFVAAFPYAKIWGFEPVSRHHARLCHRFSSNAAIRCERLAFGQTEGEIEIALTSDPSMSHVTVHSNDLPNTVIIQGSEKVTMTTLDKYCQRNRIERIDFVKIDTEGHDLEVLRGATTLLSRGLISFIQCECSASPENRYHCALGALQSFLEERGYRLFGFYEQVEDWTTGAPNLRRVNAVFISPEVIRENRT